MNQTKIKGESPIEKWAKAIKEALNITLHQIEKRWNKKILSGVAAVLLIGTILTIGVSQLLKLDRRLKGLQNTMQVVREENRKQMEEYRRQIGVIDKRLQDFQNTMHVSFEEYRKQIEKYREEISEMFK